MKVIKQLVLFVVFAGILFGVNAFTAPIIANNEAGAALGPLKEVMPDASGFETIYDVNDLENSTISDVPTTVKQIYAETSGLGYIVRLSTTEGYTHEAMEFTVAIDTEGKISNVLLTAYPETKDFGADYPSTYIGQDSALADVQLVAGVTFSSSAFKNAVNDGFETLVANDVIKAGVKSNDQLLTELIPSVATGLVNESGVLQAEEIAVDFADKAYVALNGSNVAYIMGDKMTIVNNTGVATTYDVEGNVVEADASKCLADAANHLAGASKKDNKKAAKELGETYNTLTLNTHNSVTAAFEANGTYFFIVKPYHFNNEPVGYYYTVNADGSIAKMSADELILEADFFTAYTLDEAAYKEGFVGVTADTYSDDLALIAGASFSSSAGRVATRDVFEAYASLKGE
ncbi:MAG: FMN-binding protein [Erysipelotrichaceae bacterium]|nr:FMN-binding protein [Erysipelotrichaceae bacterium]